MSVTSSIVVSQFGPGSFYVDVLDYSAYIQTSIFEYDTEVGGGDGGIHSIEALQNPRPVAGRSAHPTGDPDVWSDSPAVSPLLPDSLRFAYGRYVNRYKNLDGYAGLVMRDRIFENEGEGEARDASFVYKGSIRDQKNKEGDTEVQEHQRKSGEVEVQQFNLIVSAEPPPFSYKNAVDSNVSIQLGNYTYPLSSGTMILKINGGERTPLEIIPFYTGLGGFTATWYNDQDFAYDSEVQVEWRVRDTDSPANELKFNYWFRTMKDTLGPRISMESPQDDQVGVPIDTCIEFIVRDFETGVNIDTLELYVNNILVSIEDLVITTVPTLDGYRVRFCPPEKFLYGDDIPISIYIEDLSDPGNYTFKVYSFTTEFSLAPVVVDNNPGACREYIPTNVNVSIDVVDGGHGIDSESIDVSVDNEAVSPDKKPIIYREDE